MLRIHDLAGGARGLRVRWQCEEMGVPYEVVTSGGAFLEDAGGVQIDEPIAMMLYVSQRYGPTPLFPDKEDPLLARVLEVTAFAETAKASALAYVDDLLGPAPYFAGDRFTLADIAMSVALLSWSVPLTPRLTAYGDRMAARPAYRRAISRT